LYVYYWDKYLKNTNRFFFKAFFPIFFKLFLYFQSLFIKFKTVSAFVAKRVLILQIRCIVTLLQSYIAIFLKADILTLLQSHSNGAATFCSEFATLQHCGERLLQCVCNLCVLYEFKSLRNGFRICGLYPLQIQCRCCWLATLFEIKIKVLKRYRSMKLNKMIKLKLS